MDFDLSAHQLYGAAQGCWECVFLVVFTLFESVDLVQSAAELRRFAGWGFAGCACISRIKIFRPLVAGYHLLLSDSAEDAVDSLAAHLAARSALAQLHP